MLINRFACLLGSIDICKLICDVISIPILGAHTFLLNVFVELGEGLFFFMLKPQCVVNINSVSLAVSTNQMIDLLVTLETLDVR